MVKNDMYGLSCDNYSKWNATPWNAKGEDDVEHGLTNEIKLYEIKIDFYVSVKQKWIQWYRNEWIWSILNGIDECMQGFEDEIMNKVLGSMSETMNWCYLGCCSWQPGFETQVCFIISFPTS